VRNGDRDVAAITNLLWLEPEGRRRVDGGGGGGGGVVAPLDT